MTDHMTVLVLEPFRQQQLTRIREAAGQGANVVQKTRVSDKAQLLDLLKSADVVVGAPAPELLERAPSIRWLQLCWAGADRYLKHEVTLPEGLRITNVAGVAFGRNMSQYVLGQILALTQNLPSYVRHQSKGQWRWAGPVMTLDGTRALIFGAGDIGSWTARRLSGFDVTCIGVCRNTTAPRECFSKLVTLDQAEEELAQADVVVNCLPSSDETDGYLNERRLRLMKKGAVLINVGRGSFLDCDALADVLAEGHLRGAALDVCKPEPLPAGHRLWTEPRCLITPHISGKSFGSSRQTEEVICDIVCENLRRWKAGEELTHIVR